MMTNLTMHELLGFMSIIKKKGKFNIYLLHKGSLFISRVCWLLPLVLSIYFRGLYSIIL